LWKISKTKLNDLQIFGFEIYYTAILVILEFQDNTNQEATKGFTGQTVKRPISIMAMRRIESDF